VFQACLLFLLMSFLICDSTPCSACLKWCVAARKMVRCGASYHQPA
jgi:hypothetical protein